jgi:hypothetical protein
MVFNPCCMIVAVATLALASMGQPTRLPIEHDIDLVDVSTRGQVETVPSHRRLTPAFVESLTTDEASTKPLRLAAQLLELEREAFSIGESSVYEIVLQNISTSPIKFPSLVGSGHVDRDMAGATVATISLRFEDEVLGRQIIGYRALYGADDVPGSLLIIRPGERLRLRARAQWLLTSAMRKPLQGRWERDLDVRALVQLKAGREQVQMISANGRAVQLRW